MRRLPLLCLFVLSSVSFACNGDEEGNGNNIISNISTPMQDAGNTSEDLGTTEEDMATAADTGGTEPDMAMEELCDQNVANPGFLNGTWDVNVGGETQFELRYCHDLDNAAQPIQGTFTEVATSITGNLPNTTFRTEPFTFSVNWFVNDAQSQFQYAVSQGQQLDENRITARYIDGRTMEPSDAELIRQ